MAVHAVTKETPFFLVYGREATNPADLKIRQWMEKHQKPEKYTVLQAKRIVEAQERVIKNINKQKQYKKNRYDEGRKDPDFKIHDIVWVKQERPKDNQSTKFMAKYTGPYMIISFPPSSHNLIMEVQHVNNVNDRRNVGVKKVKKTFLKPNQLGIILSEVITNRKNATSEIEHIVVSQSVMY